MAFEISHDRTVPISEEEEAQNEGWLIDIMNERDPETRSKPRIQEVVRTLREIKSNETCFDPLVVSFGPYHYGKERLMPMERCKNVAVRWFVSLWTDKPAENVYDEFVVKATKVSSPRECYADKFLCKFQFNEFMRMMFRDGCFILYFIHLVLHKHDVLYNYSYLNVPLILRDMFLLENQIPYSILSALMSFSNDQSDESRQSIEKKDIGESRQSSEKKDIGVFIHQVFLPDQKHEDSNSSITSARFSISSLFRKIVPSLSFIREMLTYGKRREVSGGEGSNSVGKVEESDPIHLLDLLRCTLVGTPSSGRGHPSYYFRSIMELKAAGIEVSPSNCQFLGDIKYKEKLIYGHLELPQIVVDDATKTRLLNLIAYEMCPDGLSDRIVTSYICFLDSLIDRAEDVKELRSKNILLNHLGSDEEVATLFNELANNLTPNFNTYGEAKEKIQNHCNRHVKVWIAEFTHTHFTSPWTVLALMAAIFILALTVVQTVYSVMGYY